MVATALVDTVQAVLVDLALVVDTEDTVQAVATVDTVQVEVMVDTAQEDLAAVTEVL